MNSRIDSSTKLSMTNKDKQQWLIENNADTKFSMLDVRVCRVETRCDDCKKKIKRGMVYFRRSFGRKWTWRACSNDCGMNLIQRSTQW